VVKVRTRTSLANSDLSVASEYVTPGAPVLTPSPPAPNAPLGSSNGGSRTTTVTGGGFAPNTPVVVAIYSTPATLTTTTSSQSGAISVTVTIPAGYTGSHTLVATGEGPGGVNRTLAVGVRLGGGLAATGTFTIGTVLLGTGLLLIGGLVVAAIRRRRFDFVSG